LRPSAAVMASLSFHWHWTIERIVTAGQRDGIFRRNLAPAATSAVIVAAIELSLLID
jgi:hypothetical protein